MKHDRDTNLTIVTLNEAVNWLMGEPLRKPHREVGLILADQRELQSLIAACRRDLAVQRELAGVISHLPFWPPGELLQRLTSGPVGVSPSVDRLIRRAVALQKKWAQYHERYAVALERIFAAARSERLKLFGCRSWHHGAPVEHIGAMYLSSNVTIDYSRRHLAPAPGPMLFVVPQRYPDLAPIYYNVRLELEALKKAFGKPKKSAARNSPPTRAGQGAPTDAELGDCYLDFARPFDDAGLRPQPAQEEAAMSLEFPDLKAVREHARALRRKHRPEWTRPGRPKKRATK